MNKISKINKNNKSQILNTHTTTKYLIFNRDSAPSVARGNCLDRDQIGTRWDPMGWDPWEPKGIPWEGIPWEGEPLEARGIPREGTLGAPHWDPSNSLGGGDFGVGWGGVGTRRPEADKWGGVVRNTHTPPPNA